MLDQFEYVCPKNLEEFFFIQSNFRSVCLLAGGTDLIPALRAKKKHADCVVDLNGLGLDYISRGQNIQIGALTTFRSLLRDDTIRDCLPVLACAAGKIGAVQTQSLATIGGNLCNGLPSADSAPPLLVLDAQLRLISLNKERLISCLNFFTGPGKTVLEDAELLVEVIIPHIPERRASFIKVQRRKGMSLAILSCATSLCLDQNGFITQARIALGAAAPTPVRIIRAEELLCGSRPSENLIMEAAKIVSKEISPRSSIRASGEYRTLLSEVLVRRSLNETLAQFSL